MKNILAIDPGSVESGYVVTDTADGMKIQACGRVGNSELKTKIADIVSIYGIKTAVIEMIASYGMAVGREEYAALPASVKGVLGEIKMLGAGDL